MHKITVTILAFIISFSLTGCQQTENNQTKQTGSQTASQTPTKEFSPILSEQLEQTAKNVRGVDRAIAIVLKEDTSIALEVTGFDRLRLKAIKKEVNKRVKDQLTDNYKIHITTDKKIYREMQKLKGKLLQGQESPKKLIQQFDKLNKDMHG
jgi:uncharacterized lipoprotein YehR (DUF1307 family)